MAPENTSRKNPGLSPTRATATPEGAWCKVWFCDLGPALLKNSKDTFWSHHRLPGRRWGVPKESQEGVGARNFWCRVGPPLAAIGALDSRVSNLASACHNVVGVVSSGCIFCLSFVSQLSSIEVMAFKPSAQVIGRV